MSCIKKIKSEEISGSTFRGREISLIGDITDYSFIAKVKSPFQGKITEIAGVKNASKVFFPFESIKDLRNGKYIIEYWGDFADLGEEVFLVEELSIVSAEKSSGNCSNETHIFDVKINNITIPISLDFSVVNIYNNGGGSSAWGDIGGNIETQTDLIQKFGDYYTKTETYNKNEVNSLISNIDVDVDLSNYYTKPQSDSRYKSINYVPNWSEVSGKPTAFTPLAHTHPISEVTNLQTTLDNKVDKVSGKKLSTEDYTTYEKNKLSGIQEGAEVNVNADWNATSGDAQILNLPSTFTPSLHTHSISEVDNLQNTLDGKEQKISTGTTSQYWRGDKTWQTLDKNAVGLSNVDNTSDANKPISNATQTALNNKLDKGGYAGTASDLKTEIDGKANTSHTHSISDITNLQTSLDNKQNAIGYTPENLVNKATDLLSPDNTKYPTTLAVVNETKKATITVELISQLTTNFYAPNALRINSTTLISGSGTLTLKVNDVAYTLGNLIPQGAKITAETTSSSVYNLISIYE